MEFARENIAQGRLNQQQSQETPESFGTIDGATVERGSMDLATGNQRMAGQQGARAVALMNNPDEAMRTEGWMHMFGMSNQGMQWNQAKMMMAQPAPPPEQ